MQSPTRRVQNGALEPHELLDHWSHTTHNVLIATVAVYQACQLLASTTTDQA